MLTIARYRGRCGLPRWVSAGKLMRCRRAGPAIEFALVSPLLLTMLLGVFDISRAIITMQGLSVGAQEVVEAASTFAANQNTMGLITSSQGYQAISIATAWFPNWTASPTTSPYAITLSSVAMVPSPPNCTSGCTYSAQTAWSTAVAYGISPYFRPCGILAPAADTAAQSLTALPADLFSPPGLLVADVSTIYTPLFFKFITGPIAMMRSAYVPPRGLAATTYVQITINGLFAGNLCPGYFP